MNPWRLRVDGRLPEPYDFLPIETPDDGYLHLYELTGPGCRIRVDASYSAAKKLCVEYFTADVRREIPGSAYVFGLAFRTPECVVRVGVVDPRKKLPISSTGSR